MLGLTRTPNGMIFRYATLHTRSTHGLPYDLSEKSNDPFKYFVLFNLCWHAMLVKQKSGATFLEGPKQAPTGMEMRVKHPDGTWIKYVQYSDSVYSRGI